MPTKPVKTNKVKPQLTTSELREMYENIASIKASLEALKAVTEDNHRTLRGHNGTVGLLTKVSRIEDRLFDTAEKIVVMDLANQVKTLAQYPSLTWLVKHRLKQVVVITVTISSIATVLGAPIVDERLAAALTWAIIKLVTTLVG